MNIFKCDIYYYNMEISDDLGSGIKLGVTDVLSINLLKFADKENNIFFRIIGSIIGFIQYFYFSFGLASGSSYKRNAIWDIISDIFVPISGILIWKEKLTFINIIGIILGMIAIYLIEQ